MDIIEGTSWFSTLLDKIEPVFASDGDQILPDWSDGTEESEISKSLEDLEESLSLASSPTSNLFGWTTTGNSSSVKSVAAAGGKRVAKVMKPREYYIEASKKSRMKRKNEVSEIKERNGFLEGEIKRLKQKAVGLSKEYKTLLAGSGDLEEKVGDKVQVEAKRKLEQENIMLKDEVRKFRHLMGNMTKAMDAYMTTNKLTISLVSFQRNTETYLCGKFQSLCFIREKLTDLKGSMTGKMVTNFSRHPCHKFPLVV